MAEENCFWLLLLPSNNSLLRRLIKPVQDDEFEQRSQSATALILIKYVDIAIILNNFSSMAKSITLDTKL